MPTNQPEWQNVGHVGDVDPIAHGGGFVYVDKTGVYAPELTWFEPAPDEEWHKTEGKTPLQVYRLTLDPPRFKTLTEEGKRHGYSTKELPASDRGKTWYWYDEWFVRHLDSAASCFGTTKFKLLRSLFSKDPMERARVYQDLIEYHGADNFDDYPLTMTEDEAYERYAEEMSLSRKG